MRSLALVLLFSSVACAETVYTCKYQGEVQPQYHRQGCSFLYGIIRATPIEKVGKLAPCGACKPGAAGKAFVAPTVVKREVPPAPVVDASPPVVSPPTSGQTALTPQQAEIARLRVDNVLLLHGQETTPANRLRILAALIRAAQDQGLDPAALCVIVGSGKPNPLRSLEELEAMITGVAVFLKMRRDSGQ